jgi:hypothetical protein
MPPRAREVRGEERTEDGGQARRAGAAAETMPERVAEAGAPGGRRWATLNLPLFYAEFRAPGHLVPTRDDVAGVARGVRSMLPSVTSTLFYGGLAVTAVIGVIEWPVAAAIGVGAAFARRGAARS